MWVNSTNESSPSCCRGESIRSFCGTCFTLRNSRFPGHYFPDSQYSAFFRERLLERLPVRELASHFSRQRGRPTKDLHAVVGTLILQQFHDAAVEAVAINFAWQYALDIRAESAAYLCERTLRNYRALLIEHGLDHVLFRTLTDRLIEAVGVDAARQRLDSNAIRSAMRLLTRFRTVVEAITKLRRELRRLHPRLHAEVDPELVRRYADREGTGCFASTTPSESRRHLVGFTASG